MFLSEKQQKEMESANVRGARLVRKDDRYFLILTLEKEALLPKWEECETIIGVDVGMNYLVVCSAKDGKFTSLYSSMEVNRGVCVIGERLGGIKGFEHSDELSNKTLHKVFKHMLNILNSSQSLQS